MTTPLAMQRGCEALDEERLIRCRECQQVLAIRTPGGLRLRVLVPAYEQDETGRVDLDCPVCGKRRRVPRNAEGT